MAVYTKNEVKTATIANGGTASAAVELGASAVLAIEMPAAFTGTTLSIHGCSTSGGTFAALKDAAGTANSFVVAANDRIWVDPRLTAGWSWVKVVSGSAEGAERIVSLLCRPV